MKVGMIVRSQGGVPGASGVPGGQIGMVQLARALAGLGVDVQLFVGGPRMGYLEGLDDVDTTYFPWPLMADRVLKKSPARVRDAGKALRRRRWLDAVTATDGVMSADVIHVQGLEDTEALLTRVTGPLVVTHWGRVGRWQPRGTDRAGDRSLRQRVELIREQAKLVAIGEAQGDELAAAGLSPTEVIPPGIDLSHFTPGDRAAARRRAGLPEDAGIVLYVGRFAPDKNVESLLRAFAGVTRRARPARLVLIGDGPLGTGLRRLGDDLGISGATSFLPFVPHRDLPLYYRAADVLVVPSDRLETFCMVALEAIACGCPLVVTDQVPEIVRRFPAVPSVAPYDVEALRERIDAALRGEIASADNAGMSDYGWAGAARRYLDLYRTAVRG